MWGRSLDWRRVASGAVSNGSRCTGLFARDEYAHVSHDVGRGVPRLARAFESNARGKFHRERIGTVKVK